MSRIILLITLVTFFNGSFAADNYQDLWQKGNSYFQQKQYDSAAVYYNKLAEKKPDNAVIYYNLGNAYYRLNNIGKAILNYERALKNDPDFTKASDNLYLTQGRINNRIQPLQKIFFVRWWQSMTAGNLSNAYAIAAIIIFLLAIAYFILSRLGSINFSLPPQATMAMIVLCTLLIILSLASAQNAVNDDYAIVLDEGAPLMLKPESGSSKSLIPEGTKVEIEDTQSAWYEVKLPDGRTGWIQHSMLERI